MKTHFLGVIIRPHADYPNSTTLTLVMHVDIKGWLPPIIANRYLAKAPENWHTLLSNYFWNVYSKQKRWEVGTVRSSDAESDNTDTATSDEGKKLSGQ